jgi:enoyl-CoA hydratase/carnithine racemase
MSAVVLFEELTSQNSKKIGVATLNSERSLNALSGEMIDLLYPQLQQWQQDADIAAVLLQGSGEKAFCAGGDIVAMYKAMQQAPGEYTPQIEQYFTKEYQLDYLIHTYEKPFIVWGSGIVMGGGMGMMVGASHRIVTETTRLAMPEISIGLYPDVGGTWFLNRMPENCGLFLGLTGASINAADAKYTKLADHFVASDKKQQLLNILTEVKWGDTIALNHEKLSTALHQLETQSMHLMPNSQLKHHLSLINEVTSKPNLAAIVDAILSVNIEDKWFNKAQQSLKHGSAISGHIVYRQLQQGKKLTLADCFRLELNLSVKCGQFGEFKEGVRALLIDKDNQPKWKYPSISAVEPAVIDWFFEPLWPADKHPLKSLGE